MCKLLIIPKVESTKDVTRFLKAAKTPMSKVERDGYGYAALTESGSLRVERWLNPSKAFKPQRVVEIPGERNALEGILDCIDSSEVSEYFESGPSNESWKSVIAHSRFATCEKGIENVHPFFNDTTALIHNGRIENPEVYGSRISTCDSEGLLNGYVTEGIADDPSTIQNLTDKIDGYFALGVLAKTSEGQWILDIIKDAQAHLHCAYIPRLRTVVFATSSEIIRYACKKLRWKCGRIHRLKDGTLIRFDAWTGQTIETLKFDADPTEEITSEVDAISLGIKDSYSRTLDDADDWIRIRNEYDKSYQGSPIRYRYNGVGR